MRKRLAGFATMPMIVAIAPLLALPLLARVASPSEWAALGLGQSIGMFCAVVLNWGLSVVGPVESARARTESDRTQILRVSTAMRSTLIPPALLVSGALCFVVSPAGQTVLTLLACASSGAAGLSFSWYAIGVGKPSILLYFELIPRLVGTLVAASAVIVSGIVVLFPLIQLCTFTLGTAAFIALYSALPNTWDYFKIGIRTILSQRNAAITSMLGASYSALPTALVGTVVPAVHLAGFVSIEKIYRLGVVAVSALVGGLQGWVSEEESNKITKRMKIALVAHSAFGMIGFTAIAGAGPFATRILFGESLECTYLESVAFGAAFFFLSINSCLGAHFLVPMNRVNSVLWSTAVGSLVGLPLILGLAATLGPWGGAMGLAIGEGIVCIVQVITIARIRRRPNRYQGKHRLNKTRVEVA